MRIAQFVHDLCAGHRVYEKVVQLRKVVEKRFRMLSSLK